MILTAHAKDRLKERGVPLPAVMAAVRHGEVEEKDGAYRATLMGVTAVVDAKTGVLITAWDDSPHQGRRAYSPKRAAKAKRIQCRHEKLKNKAMRAC